MDKKEEKLIETYKKNEEKIVVDVIKTYANINEISFIEIQENNMTGYTHYAFTLNGNEGYSYLFSKNDMYGNESVVNPNIKKRDVELTDNESLKELKKLKVNYGGWGN